MDQRKANTTIPRPARTARPTADFASQADTALARVLADAPIDPREPGLIYDNVDGIFEVLDIEFPPKGARRFLIRNLHTKAVTSTGAVWTVSDRVLKAVSA